MNKQSTSQKASLTSRTFHSGFWKALFASVFSLLIGLVLGFIIMLIVSFTNADAHPWEGLLVLFAGPFSALRPVNALGNMIFYTVPLIFTGLSVAIAYKTGLFNIGAAGQFIIGTLVSLEIALNINSIGKPTQAIFVWLLAVVAGCLGGILWGLIPGALKAFFGINEVIICIMTNWIAANLATWVFSSQVHLSNIEGGKSGYLITTSSTGNSTPAGGLGKLTGNSYLDISIIIAIVIAILIWLLLNKTTLGYSMKACGMNKYSAKYAGINDKLNIMISMGLAGGLAALGGAFYYLNPGIELQFKSIYQNLPSYGFDGISAAFLANISPLAVIFSSLLIRYLSAAGSNLTSAGYNSYFADIIIASIIYLAGFSRIFQEMIPNIVKTAKASKAKAYHKALTEGLDETLEENEISGGNE